MINIIMEISLSMTAVILLVLALVPLMNKRYSAKGRRMLWMILAVRLLIPVNLTLPKAPVTIEPKERSVVLRTDASVPFQVMETEKAWEMGAMQANSANYAQLFSVTELLTFIWLCGAAAFVLFHLISYWRFRFKIRKKTERVGEYRGVEYCRCPFLESPIMTGFLRPTILLPAEDFSPEELEIILEHEYTHLRRGDLWYKLILMLANAAHWFNPAVYLMVRQADRDLEYSCDEAVVKGKSLEFRKLYSMTILKAMKRKEEHLDEAIY